jgi:hypothetical protein
MLADLTIIPAHTAEDAGKILENYKIYENKPVDVIQEKQDSSIVQQVRILFHSSSGACIITRCFTLAAKPICKSYKSICFLGY